MQGPAIGKCIAGGKLIQDLGNTNLIHRKEGDADKQHKVIVVAESLLNDITKSFSSEINSAHHQAVNAIAIGENLMVNALSQNDLVIEGLELKNKTGKAFMLCVQWHPERMIDKELHPFSKNIKERFLTEVKNTTIQKLSVINPATEVEIM